MVNELYNMEEEKETPEFTEEEKTRLTSVLEAKQAITNKITPILMPKLSYRFKVSFVNFGTGNGLDLTRQVVRCETPTMLISPTGISYSEFSVTFRNDLSSLVQIEISDQLKKQQATSAKFDCIVEMLDGTMNAGMNVLEKRTYSDCFLTRVNFSDVDYSITEAQEITITVAPGTVSII